MIILQGMEMDKPITRNDVVKALYKCRDELKDMKRSDLQTRSMAGINTLIYLISNLREDNNLNESIATEMFKIVERYKGSEVRPGDPRPDEEERGQGSLPGM